MPSCEGIARNDTDLGCLCHPREDCLQPLQLSEPKLSHLFDFSSDSEFDCVYDEWLKVANVVTNHNLTADHARRITETGCPPLYDIAGNCWPFTPSNFTHTANCPDFLPDIFSPDKQFEKTCLNGLWSKANYTSCLLANGSEKLKNVCLAGHYENYSELCEELGVTTPMDVTTPWSNLLVEDLSVIQRDIYFFGSFASLLFLTIALIIFCMFKALQCPRVHIHKNLVISLLIQCIVNIVIFEPYVQLKSVSTEEVIERASRTTYIEHSWLCKILFTLSNYVTMTNLFWGFVEGLFLISRISIAVFSNSTPYWLFYVIGWGIPAVFSITWAICMQVYSQEQTCWRNFAEESYFHLITVPTVTVALINAIFLIFIIRILVTKLHAINMDDHVQVRKAMKAAVVLLPLLSITSLLFIWAPRIEAHPRAHYAYRITNASLHVAQGILVSVIFCFFNGEVRSALVNHWKQWRSETFRYPSSRASSVCVTQSEHMVSLGGGRKLSHSSHMSYGLESGGTAV